MDFVFDVTPYRFAEMCESEHILNEMRLHCITATNTMLDFSDTYLMTCTYNTYRIYVRCETIMPTAYGFARNKLIYGSYTSANTVR